MRLSFSQTPRLVVLCDSAGMPLGTSGLLEAHQGTGILHKAFSIFIFRNRGSEVLLQQRSRHKRLFALRWANTCCSHAAADGEALGTAAERRLQEELGFSLPLRAAGEFVYRAKDPAHDFSEYEYDTVFVGYAVDVVTPHIDPDEIAAWRWTAIDELQRDLRQNTAAYAPWLVEALPFALASLLAARP